MARQKKQPKIGIGKRLEELRQDKGLSQEELADALHMSRSALNMRERGERGLSCEDADQVAAFFGISTDELIRGIKPQNTEIHAATGLSDEAIEVLRSIKSDDPTGQAMEAINRAISSRVFLNVLSALLSVQSDERGYYDATLSPQDGIYRVELSPDSYAAVLEFRLLHTLEAIRTGGNAALQPYAPARRRDDAVTDQLRAEGRLIE